MIALVTVPASDLVRAYALPARAASEINGAMRYACRVLNSGDCIGHWSHTVCDALKEANRTLAAHLPGSVFGVEAAKTDCGSASCYYILRSDMYAPTLMAVEMDETLSFCWGSPGDWVERMEALGYSVP